MALFVSSYVNKVDKKGRVSVPANFRKALEGEAFEGIFVFPSLTKPCLEGGGQSYIEMLARAIEDFDPLTEDQEDFALTLIGGSTPLSFDGDGRVTFGGELAEFAGITEACAFVGMGDHFEIWEPEALEARKAEARVRAAQKRALLKRPRPHEPQGGDA